MPAERRAVGEPAIVIRRAAPGDADAIASLYLTSFRATYAFPLAHSDGEVADWIRDEVVGRQETWVAVAGDDVVGVMALGEDALDQLYLRPGWWRRGIGSRLVALAKERRPAGLDLYTFQANAGARAFYERHDFSATWFGDGSANEEGQPDVRYAWRP